MKASRISKRPRRSEVLLACVLVSACVADTGMRRIRPDDTGWIQRDQTTREEVIARFGEPSLTLVEEGSAIQYAEYRSTPEMGTYAERGGSQVFVPIQNPLPQAYPSAEQAGLTRSELQPLGDRFWLRYDEHGVVKDFGFGVPTKKD
jgi:hypothetical protein